MMYRAAAPRGSLLRPLTHNITPTPCFTRSFARFSTRAKLTKAIKPAVRSDKLALTTYRPNTALIRSYASVHGTTRDSSIEEKARESTLEPHPELVSSISSTHPAFQEVQVADKEKEENTDMLAGIRHDIAVIADTFNVNAVPREALRIGLAGVIPYLVTSTATVVCAFELNAAAHSGTGFLMSEQSAEALLHVLEPLQVGYGAVILSCLGTIHWGLEWAQYGGSGGYKRYMIGVLTPAIAWPTILLPVEYALITQFLAFNLLYAVDSATVTRGWTPPWYGTYRFILTFVVGASIVVSLIGRGQIQDRVGAAPTAAARVRELQNVGLKQHAKASGKATSSEMEED